MVPKAGEKFDLLPRHAHWHKMALDRFAPHTSSFSCSANHIAQRLLKKGADKSREEWKETQERMNNRFHRSLLKAAQESLNKAHDREDLTGQEDMRFQLQEHTASSVAGDDSDCALRRQGEG